MFREKDSARCKAALKEAHIQGMESGFLQDELPLCACGPKLDHPDYGPNARIDRRIYYSSASPEDA